MLNKQRESDSECAVAHGESALREIAKVKFALDGRDWKDRAGVIFAGQIIILLELQRKQKNSNWLRGEKISWSYENVAHYFSFITSPCGVTAGENISCV